MSDTLTLIFKDAFWSALAAIGFAILFNAPQKTLFGCAMIGAIGHSLRALLMEMGMQIELATLIGATSMGFMGIYFARRLKVPIPIFTVSGAITMVPGVFAYRTMIGLLTLSGTDATSAMLLETSVNAIKTGLILGAIAGGIAAPTLIFQRQKPVV